MAITPTKVFPYGALALLLSACAALQTAGGQVSANPSGQGTGTSATPSAEKGGPGFTSTSPVGEAGSAVLKGAATGPAGLVSGNTSALLGNAGAGLVGNSGAGLIGNSGAGLIGNAGAGYRIQAFAQDPIANALVYLTDPQERFFSRSDGTIVSTTTTASGDFIFPNTITASADTIVNVILAGNRREVGFTLPVAGVNVVEISVSSTFVTEFIRQHAKRDGKAMGAYPGGMASLPRLTELTRAALDAGQLTFDGTATGSLNIGNIEGSLNRLYGIAVGKNLNGLGEAWASFFGYRVRALETILGTGENGLADGGPATTVPINVPQELALAADGTLYLAEEKNNLVRVVKPDGTAAIVAGSSKGTAGSSGDGGKATSAQFSNPRAVALGPDGNLYVADASAIRVVALTATPSPWAGGTWQVGNIYRVVGSGLNPASVDGPVASASVVSPRGMLIDGTGNLYFTEGKTTQAGVAAWNHVRVITPSSAAEQTLFGVTCASGSVTKLAGADNSAGFA
ncbi:MAG: hypothetical protein FJZ00_09380, partial [Candidatus Sericytochromatia bacterium]|nr:hypothetical protein [Candidatus Tanganyikabacteria bacterium]